MTGYCYHCQHQPVSSCEPGFCSSECASAHQEIVEAGQLGNAAVQCVCRAVVPNGNYCDMCGYRLFGRCPELRFGDIGKGEPNMLVYGS